MSDTQTENPAPTPTTETPKITTATKAVKVKDPKRVEQGKRLAAISKAAKERKARERMQAEIDEASWKIDYGTVFGVLGSLVAVVAVVYATKKAGAAPPHPQDPKTLKTPRTPLIRGEHPLTPAVSV